MHDDRSGRRLGPQHDTLTLSAAKYADLPAGPTTTSPRRCRRSCCRARSFAALKDGDPVAPTATAARRQLAQGVCAPEGAAGDDAARTSLRGRLTSTTAAARAARRAKLTAYDVQEMHASRKKHGKFRCRSSRTPPTS